jgi:hypothetical protein
MVLPNNALHFQHAFANIPARSAIDKVIPRAAIDIDDGCFPWASDFTLLSGSYVGRIALGALTGHWQQTYPQAPRPGGGGDRHHLNVGDAELSIDYLQPAGWMIELIHEDLEDCDGRILTFVRGNMPVLCPTFRSAMRLAEASFPNSHYHLCWRSIKGPVTRITDVPSKGEQPEASRRHRRGEIWSVSVRLGFPIHYETVKLWEM